MNLKLLQDLLKNLRIPESYYSLNSGLKYDAFIIEEQDGKWIYFYFDEKGNREDEHVFYNENEVCEYLLKKIQTEYEYPSDKYTQSKS